MHDVQVLDIDYAWFFIIWLLVAMGLMTTEAAMDGQRSTATTIDTDSDDLELDLMPAGVGTLEVNRIEVSGGIPEKAGWVRMLEDMTIDTGAAHSVNDGVKYTLGWALVPSVHSERGVHYVGPGGERMKNRGQRIGQVMFENGLVAKTCLQDSSVRKPLISVNDTLIQKNVALFTNLGSIIAPESDPAIQKILQLIPLVKNAIKMHRHQGTFKVPTWIKREAAPVFSRQPR
jgi:hypothetical protein